MTSQKPSPPVLDRASRNPSDLRGVHTTSDTQPSAASLVERFGIVSGGAALGSILASLPAVFRMGSGSGVLRVFEHWVALSAILTPLAMASLLVVRRGRVGLRFLVGDYAPLFVAVALWWAVVELSLLSIVGAVLRAKTHHHGLAGVTFAAVALTTGVGVALVAVRGGQLLHPTSPRAHRLALAVAASSAVVVLALSGLRTSRAAELHTAAALTDTLALLVTVSVASSRAVARWRTLGVVGVAVATGVLLLGFACLRIEPDIQEMLVAGAPIQAWLLALVSVSR